MFNNERCTLWSCSGRTNTDDDVTAGVMGGALGVGDGEERLKNGLIILVRYKLHKLFTL